MVSDLFFFFKKCERVHATCTGYNWLESIAYSLFFILKKAPGNILVITDKNTLPTSLFMKHVPRHTLVTRVMVHYRQPCLSITFLGIIAGKGTLPISLFIEHFPRHSRIITGNNTLLAALFLEHFIRMFKNTLPTALVIKHVPRHTLVIRCKITLLAALFIEQVPTHTLTITSKNT